MTAEELTVSSANDDIYNKQGSNEDMHEAVVPAASVAIENSSPAPSSAFCFLPNKLDVLENHHRQLPLYTAAVAGTLANGGTMELFQDGGAYVQRCLSFVALPTPEYMPQTGMTGQPHSVVYHHQP